MVKTASSPEYVDWLQEIEKCGGEFSWIRASKDFPQNVSEISRPKLRPVNEINQGVLDSHRIQSTIVKVAEESGQSRNAVQEEAKEILLTMAHSFSMTTVRPIGYMVVKVIKKLFDSVQVNLKQLAEVRQLTKRDPVVFMPTHNSYVDFLLLSLLCFDQNITLPAIAAGADFMNSKIMGEALRRCGAFFIRRSFGKDLLYWAIFTEYVQTHLINSDRPVEFFVEGTRSRTSKSLHPKFGLLQVLVEPYLRGQVYDIVIVPVSMNYDKILEEFLYAYELLGFPKPKESTSGLFKARQILNQKFGRIYMTFGKPLSLRKYFGTSVHRSAFVCQPDSQFVLSSREKLAIRTLGHRIIETHNKNRVVGVWPYACLIVQEMLDNRRTQGNADQSIVYQELLISLKRFLALVQSLGIAVQIESTVEDELRYYSALHNDLFDFVPSSHGNDDCLILREQDVVSGTHIEKTVLQDAVSSVLLSNYSNMAIPHLFDVSLLSLVVLHSNVSKGAELFCNLRESFMREFVFVPGTSRELYERSRNSLIRAKLISLEDTDCVQIDDRSALSQLAGIIQPFVATYLFAINVILEIPLPPFSLAEAVQRIQIALARYLQDPERKAVLRASVLSTDLIKNILHTLIDSHALKKMTDGLYPDSAHLQEVSSKFRHVCLESLDFYPRYYPKL
ncbi:hypothetical protein L596_003309 [Steinernema carpocapsae]|uniref:Phospholipid/glycerol acyltransferase domain-containing protein n=1 Tax=Steinernema carpocapsae TaxID=34508 RepID=A0A4V6I7R2_STECR|nr:hypothetical protein L596_003309 [Steinernema carpocapsae]